MIVAIELFVLALVFGIIIVDTVRRTARPTSQRGALTKADEERVDPESRQWLANIEAQLAALGFSTPCRMLLEGSAVTAFASLAEHDGNLVTVYAARSSRGTSSTGITYFGGLGDGRRVVTTNVDTVRYLPGDPRVVGGTFAGTHDVAELYDIHRFQVREYGQDAGIARLSRGDTIGEAIAYEDREADLFDAYLVNRGIFARTGTTLKLTWKGAVLVLCRAVFPWRQIDRRQRARRRAATLARYRAAVVRGGGS